MSSAFAVFTRKRERYTIPSSQGTVRIRIGTKSLDPDCDEWLISVCLSGSVQNNLDKLATWEHDRPQIAVIEDYRDLTITLTRNLDSMDHITIFKFHRMRRYAVSHGLVAIFVKRSEIQKLLFKLHESDPDKFAVPRKDRNLILDLPFAKPDRNTLKIFFAKNLPDSQPQVDEARDEYICPDVTEEEEKELIRKEIREYMEEPSFSQNGDRKTLPITYDQLEDTEKELLSIQKECEQKLQAIQTIKESLKVLRG